MSGRAALGVLVLLLWSSGAGLAPQGWWLAWDHEIESDKIWFQVQRSGTPWFANPSVYWEGTNRRCLLVNTGAMGFFRVRCRWLDDTNWSGWNR